MGQQPREIKRCRRVPLPQTLSAVRRRWFVAPWPHTRRVLAVAVGGWVLRVEADH